MAKGPTHIFYSILIFLSIAFDIIVCAIIITYCLLLFVWGGMTELLTDFSFFDGSDVLLRDFTRLWLYTRHNVMSGSILGFTGRRLTGEFCSCFEVDSILGYTGKRLTGKICSSFMVLLLTRCKDD